MNIKLNKNRISISKEKGRNLLVKSIDNQTKYTFAMLYDQLAVEPNNSGKSTNRYQSKLPKIRFKNSLNISDSKDYLPRFNPNKFNLAKKVKEIRCQTRDNTQDQFKNESSVVFSKEHADFVFESTNLLKAVQKRKENSLFDEVSSLNTLMTESKETRIKNILIKLIDEETRKYDLHDQENQKSLNTAKSNWENYQKLFTNVTENHKKSSVEIDNYLTEILWNKREWEEVMNTEVIESRAVCEEITKLLEQWDSMRICAKFVYHVMGEDGSKYSKEIKFENNHFSSISQDAFNVEHIAEKVIQDYNFLLKNKSQEVKIEHNDPSIMTQKLNEYEIKILKLWESLHEANENNKRQKREYDFNLRESAFRVEMHNKEYDYFNKEWNNIESSINVMIGNNIENDPNMIKMIKDIEKTLYYSEDLPMIRNNKKNKWGEIMKDWVNKWKNTEIKMDDLIYQWQGYEKDRKLFNEIVNNRKTKNKDYKQHLAKIKLEQIEKMKRNRAEIRLNRIIVKTRKTEAPYYKERKYRNYGSVGNQETHTNEELDITFE